LIDFAKVSSLFLKWFSCQSDRWLWWPVRKIPVARWTGRTIWSPLPDFWRYQPRLLSPLSPDLSRRERGAIGRRADEPGFCRIPKPPALTDGVSRLQN